MTWKPFASAAHEADEDLHDLEMFWNRPLSSTSKQGEPCLLNPAASLRPYYPAPTISTAILCRHNCHTKNIPR